MLPSGKVDRARLRAEAPALLAAYASAVRPAEARAAPTAATLPTEGESTTQVHATPSAEADQGVATVLHTMRSILRSLIGRELSLDESCVAAGCSSYHAARFTVLLQQSTGCTMPAEALLRDGVSLRTAATQLRQAKAVGAAPTAGSARRLRGSERGGHDDSSGEEEEESRAQAPELRSWRCALETEHAHVGGKRRARESDASASSPTGTARRVPPQQEVVWTLGRGSSVEYHRQEAGGGGRASATATAPASEAAPSGAPAGMRPNAADGGAPRLTIARSWRVDLGKCVDAAPILVCMASVGGFGSQVTAGDAHELLCLVGSHAGRICAVGFEDGKVRWSSQLPDRIEAACCVVSIAAPPPFDATRNASETVVLIGSHDEHMHALRLSDGQRVWSRRARGIYKAAARPLPGYSGVAMSACFGGEIAALDASSGRTIWRCLCDAPIFATPLADEVHLCVATLRGELLCWSHAHAEVRTFATPGPCSMATTVTRSCPAQSTVTEPGFQQLWRFATTPRSDSGDGMEPIFSSPAFATASRSKLVLFGCTDGFLYAVSVEAGACVWRYDACSPIFCAPCLCDEGGSSARQLAYITSQAIGLCCIDVNDGTLVWASKAGAFQGHPTPAVEISPRAAMVVAADIHGHLHFYHPTDGHALVAPHTLPAAVFSSPLLHAGRCIVGCRDDGLWCLSLSAAQSPEAMGQA